MVEMVCRRGQAWYSAKWLHPQVQESIIVIRGTWTTTVAVQVPRMKSVLRPTESMEPELWEPVSDGLWGCGCAEGCFCGSIVENFWSHVAHAWRECGDDPSHVVGGHKNLGRDHGPDSASYPAAFSGP